MTTKTATHTPGPWTNQRKDREAFICGSAVHVASVPLEDEQDEANAQLIAAAPEMLELIQALADGWTKAEEGGAIDGGGDLPVVRGILRRYRGDARALLAKIEGR